MIEEWKDIEGYNGDYQISNFGRVKSLKFNKIKTLKLQNNGRYYHISLSQNNNIKTYLIHHLVFKHFNLYKIDMDIDHIDNNKLNNRIDNLQLLSRRENTSKRSKSSKKTSKYTGVSYYTPNKNWRANIRFENKQIHIGYFNNEYDAHLAYKKELEKING